MSGLLTHLSRPPIARPLAAFAAAALAGVAAIHLIDGPMSLEDTAYVGVLELALAAAATVTAVALVVEPVRDVWLVAAVLVGAAIVAYVVSRTVGLPGSMDDIGNWGEPIGVINLVAETMVLALAAGALHRSADATE